MAVVSQVIAMQPTYQPYERPPDPAALWTAIPRGLRGFVIVNGTVDVKPINDQQTLSLTGTLPANFAYVFSEIGLRLSQDVAGDWHGNFNFNLQNWYQGALALSMSWVQEFGTADLLDGERSHGRTPNIGPRGVMWAPRDVSGILINITAFNEQTPAALAGTFSVYVNFWEFDLEQARKYPVNTPVPVHTR